MKQLLIISFLLGLIPNAFAQSSDAVSLPTFKPGDSWTYTRVDKLDRTRSGKYVVTVTSTSGEGYETAIQVVEGSFPGWADRYAKDGNPVSFEGQAFDPFIPLYSFPLATGKQWEGKYSWWGRANTRLTAARRATVVGWESVKTPAGEFKALKMTSETQISSQFGFGTQIQAIVWYASEVRRPVRIETKWVGGLSRDEVTELVAYKPAP